MARRGIEQIKIPIRPDELTIEAVEPYLSEIFQQFKANILSIRSDYNEYCLDHKILLKVRPHDDTEVNNIVLIPDLRAMVDWKTGYIFGNPIKYAQSKSRNTDDINYLNKYVRSSCKRSIDKEVGTWAFATGVGYYFIEPKSAYFDIETESPFEIYCRESDTCAKIYSSYGGNKPLFDLLYTKIQRINKNGIKELIDIIDLYFPDKLYTYENPTFNNINFNRVKEQDRGLYRYLPLVEKRFNPDGIGMVAMGESMQNAADNLLSNGLDNIEDVVNEIYVYKNVNLGETPEEQKNNHTAMKKNGAVVLKSVSQDLPADLTTISTKLNLSEVVEVFSIINSIFHSTLGVPMEMSGTNSGGTTKQGSEVANGYDNAYNRALDDINTFIKADTELLERIIWICKNTPGSKLDDIAASEIEIMYSINLTDNIQTKSQAFGTFMQYMPPDMALRICRLSNDPETDGKAIEEYMKNKTESQPVTQTDTVVEEQNQTVTETVTETTDIEEPVS